MQEPCGKCAKTVYANEKLEAAGKWFHKGCFKCSNAECSIQLNLKSFKAAEGQIWCEKHTPKAQYTTVTDSVSVMHALHAPKKSTEGLHKVQVGTGEAPSIGLETMSMQHALTAPKKPVENLGNVKKDEAIGA
ncbi:hypothetical protein HK105_208458 [Polyrhizophydium stewartii]|uniref:LIM zinc-binding domain-containing protein n=1 Tax=Polyrhizophydium stewartii TaxID=2732419 RepID=A0ABR4MXP7_9FUNG|nr:hypothetical protein HK105_005121 [Polyrhizophydium stewartii]